MTRQIHSGIRQATFRVRDAHNARRRQCGIRVVAVGRDVQAVAGCLLEALEAAPGGVLDLQDGAVGDEDHVEQAVGDDHILRALDDAWQDGDGGWEGAVALGEDVDVGALLPFDVRGVDSVLDIGSIKVNYYASASVLAHYRTRPRPEGLKN